MSNTSRAILLVADISGFTHFMKQHMVSINHAKQIVVRLLKALMQAAQPPLKVAELEGDAVFFYALAGPDGIESVARSVKQQMVQLFTAFQAELDSVNDVKTCKCDACEQASDLRLKQVSHVGEVALERIEQYEKLFGIDVIVVHRLLKNTVPSSEYVLMTEPLFKTMNDFYGLSPERYTEECEGIGTVETVVFYPRSLAGRIPDLPVKPPPTMKQKLGWRLKISWNLLLDILGIRHEQGSFRNIPD